MGMELHTNQVMPLGNVHGNFHMTSDAGQVEGDWQICVLCQLRRDRRRSIYPHSEGDN